MEKSKKSYPSLPSNYITIVDLQNRWLKQKQQQQQQQQQEDDDQKVKKEEKEKTTDNLTKNDAHNFESVKVKSHSQLYKPIPSNFVKNPNFNTRNGHFHRNKPVKEFCAVERSSNSSPESSQINVANHIFSNFNEDGDGDDVTRYSQFRNKNVAFLGKKLVKEFREVEKASNSSSESSQIGGATPKVESNHILSNFSEDGGGENEKKNSQFRNGNVDFSSKKLVKEFGVVKNASNSTPEASEINVETAKEEPKHILGNNEDEDGEIEKRNSQFRDRNVNNFGKKYAKEFRVVRIGSNSSSESSQINVETAKVESNHIFINNEDEIGENVRKNLRFRKNPNFKINRQKYRNYNGEERLKEVERKVDVAIVGNDDRKFEDDDEMNAKKKIKKKKKKKKKIWYRSRDKKKNDQTIVDDQTVEKKDNHDEGENQTVVKDDIDYEADDQTVEKRDSDGEGDDQTVEKRDNDGEEDDHTVEKRDNDNEGDDQTVVKRDNDDEGEDRMVEKKDNQENGENQTVEIEGKMKEVKVSENSERSTAVIKEGRRVYVGYRRVNRREYGKMNWGARRERGIYDGRSTVVIQGQREVYRGYSGVERRGSFNRRNFRGDENVIDQDYGRSTAVIEGRRGVHRGHSGGENRGKLMWVKKNEEQHS